MLKMKDSSKTKFYDIWDNVPVMRHCHTGHTGKMHHFFEIPLANMFGELTKF